MPDNPLEVIPETQEDRQQQMQTTDKEMDISGPISETVNRQFRPQIYTYLPISGSVPDDSSDISSIHPITSFDDHMKLMQTKKELRTSTGASLADTLCALTIHTAREYMKGHNVYVKLNLSTYAINKTNFKGAVADNK